MPESGNHAVLESFWEQVTREGTPLVEPIPGDEKHVLVTFLWRAGEGIRNVVLISPLRMEDEFKKEQLASSQFARLRDTDLWYRTEWLRKDSRFTYLISPNDALIPSAEVKDWKERKATWQLDPLNRRHYVSLEWEGGDRTYSVFELPDAPSRSWAQPQPDVPTGDVQVHRLKSKVLGNERNIYVHTPPKYDPKGGRYPLLVLFDGGFYRAVIHAPTILDNVQAKGGLPPQVVVMVGEPSLKDRILDLGCYPPFNDFLAQELIPWVHQHYRVTASPANTIVGWVSLGGLAAAFAALQHPAIFGNVLSQSGYFAWKAGDWDSDTEEGNEANDADYGWVIRQYVASPQLPLRFYLDVGLFERPVDLLRSNRHMRDVLQAKGYPVYYREFSGGHDSINAEATLADGLLLLAGTKSSSKAARK